MTICRKGLWAARIDPQFKPLQNVLFKHFDITACEAALLQEVISKLGKSTAQAADILGITLQKRETPGEPIDPPYTVTGVIAVFYAVHSVKRLGLAVVESAPGAAGDVAAGFKFGTLALLAGVGFFIYKAVNP